MARSNALDIDDPECFDSVLEAGGSGAEALLGEGSLGGEAGGFSGEFVDVSFRGPSLWREVDGSSETLFWVFE